MRQKKEKIILETLNVKFRLAKENVKSTKTEIFGQFIIYVFKINKIFIMKFK